MTDSRRGFTFLELTIVVLIVGLLTAIGAPRFSRSLRTRNVRNAAIQLAAYVDYVRQTAINEGRSASLSVSTSEDRFTSPDVDFPDQVGVPISVPLKEMFDVSIELNASFDSGRALTFDLEGMPTVAGAPLINGVIQIRSPEIGYRIRINSGTGMVTIEEVSGAALDAFLAG